ncbi:MAG TPA: hypothetical protein VE826_08990, partial [Dongiaceae bacterium]|nr:hypothetical protein [Dongiaceae bacterium]
RLEAAARRAGNESVRLYAILNAFAIEVDAGNTSALDRLTSELSAMQLLMTRAVSEALLPAQALRAAWNADFAHAYELLAPGAPKLADRLRAAYRWAEVAVYAAAARRAPEARAALAALHERLAGVAPAQPLAIRAVAYRALAEMLVGDAAAAARTIAEARRLAARAPARGRALVEAIAALVACRREGARRFRDLAVALDALDAHALGGVARLLARLPVDAIERAPRWEPAVLGAAG